MDKWMFGWIGCVEIRMDGRMDRSDGWIDKGTGRNKYGWMRGWARENIEEQKDKLMNYDSFGVPWWW